MAKIVTVYKVKKITCLTGAVNVMEGTLDQLLQGFSNTLDTGSSLEHENGNKKINRKNKQNYFANNF